MKKIAAILLVVIFVTMVLPLVIVFVMEKTIDNNPGGSAETLENAAETEAPVTPAAEVNEE